MSALVTCLSVGLALALVTVLYLAVSLPRRVVRLVFEERAATDRARAEKAALKAATAVEVQGLVYALRTYQEEVAGRARVAREITTAAAAEEVTRIVGPLRALVAWLGAFVDAHGADAAETMPRPGHAPASRRRPSPHVPAVGLSGSAPLLPPGPAQVAAGLGPRPGPTTSPTPARKETMVGIDPPARDDGDSDDRTPSPPRPRGAVGSTPTLLSMPALVQPSTRPAPSIGVESRADHEANGGAS